jgi:anaerobic glycerol-3-phosphate dehydrogenase
MTSGTPSLAGRAEALLNRLAQVEAQETDQQDRIEITRIQLRASNNRVALATALGVIPVLAQSGVNPVVGTPSALDLGAARRVLRATASNLVGSSAGEAASRVKRQSVNNALATAEKFSRNLESALNRSVEKRRQELLPAGIDRPVIAYPGASDALAVRLRGFQIVLLRKIDGFDPSELEQRLRKIVTAAESWSTERPRLDEALDGQHPEVKNFLTQAATDEGAPWSLITPAVSEWLANPDNTVDLKVVLGR